MGEVKWIRINTDMFEDEKIKLIEQMPDADTILVIWIKLLSQAGKTNASGYIFLSEQIPYTEEMLATIFNRPLNTVRMALNTFKSFGMIEIDEDDFINISNWEKHQNAEGLEKIREQNRQRVAKHRNRKKIQKSNGDVTLPVTLRNGTEGELELEGEEDKEKDNIPYVEIVNYLNQVADKQYKHTTKKTRTLIHARYEEGFTLNDFKSVIDTKVREWKNDSKMKKFLRPETLFSPKFEGYLNQDGGQNSNDPYDNAF